MSLVLTAVVRQNISTIVHYTESSLSLFRSVIIIFCVQHDFDNKLPCTELCYSQPLRFNTGDPDSTSYNVTGLQPDTRYKVQVAALTRKGDGTRSQPVSVKTPGGVPSRPDVDLK